METFYISKVSSVSFNGLKSLQVEFFSDFFAMFFSETVD